MINDGRLVAFSADDGEKLFEEDTGLGGGRGPPITYLVDGRQYVSVMGGQGSNPPAGPPAGPGPGPGGPGEAPPANPTPRILTYALPR